MADEIDKYLKIHLRSKRSNLARFENNIKPLIQYIVKLIHENYKVNLYEPTGETTEYNREAFFDAIDRRQWLENWLKDSDG